MLGTADIESVLVFFLLVDRQAFYMMAADVHKAVVVLASSVVVPCHT